MIRGALALEYALRIFGFFTGATLTVFVVLLYESESRRVQGRLEDWWLRVAEEEGQQALRNRGFVRAAATGLLHLFGMLFGESWLSFIRASIALSLASTSLFHGLMALSLHQPLFVRNFFASGLLFLLTLYAHARSRSGWFVEILIWVGLAWAILVFIPTFGTWWFAYGAVASGVRNTYIAIPRTAVWQEGTWQVAYSLIVGVTTDVLFLAFTKWVLRRARDRGALMAVLLLVVHATIAIALVVAPFELFGYSAQQSLNARGWFGWAMAWLLILSPETNLLDGLISVAIAAGSAAIVLHRVLWPIFTRLSYWPIRGNVVAKKLTLFSVGIAIMGASCAPTESARGILRVMTEKLLELPRQEKPSK